MIRPLRDYILVKPLERIKSNIIHVIMDEKPNLGTVVAVGKGKTVKGRVQPLDVKVGQTIRYGDTSTQHLSFTSIEHNRETYLLMQEADVCFIQEEENEPIPASA